MVAEMETSSDVKALLLDRYCLANPGVGATANPHLRCLVALEA